MPRIKTKGEFAVISWLIQNGATIVISVILIAVVAAVVTHMIKNKKKGRTSCGCGCSNCPMSEKCDRSK